MDQLIPLDKSPNQRFQIALSIDGETFTFALFISYNEMAGYWTMRISDTAGGVILDSIPFVTGDWPAANMLAQYVYLKIGSAQLVNAGSVAQDYPDSASLGSAFILIWGDTAA